MARRVQDKRYAKYRDRQVSTEHDLSTAVAEHLASCGIEATHSSGWVLDASYLDLFRVYVFDTKAILYRRHDGAHDMRVVCDLAEPGSLAILAREVRACLLAAGLLSSDQLLQSEQLAQESDPCSEPKQSISSA